MYKSGDKIIAKIDEIDASGLNKGDNVAFYNSQLIGKLEDVNLDEKKITMTPNEKKEFDRLCQNSGDDIVDSFNNIADYYHIYPNLNKRLFLGTLEKNKYVQREFVRALEKPSLIEVEKPKKYYVHLFPDKPRTYLGYERIFKTYFIGSKDKETHRIQRKFTKDEIKNFDLSFVIKSEALEEVEEDE